MLRPTKAAHPLRRRGAAAEPDAFAAATPRRPGAAEEHGASRSPSRARTGWSRPTTSRRRHPRARSARAGPSGAFAAQLDADGNAIAAAVLADGRLAWSRRGRRGERVHGRVHRVADAAPSMAAPRPDHRHGHRSRRRRTSTPARPAATCSGGPSQDGQPGELRRRSSAGSAVTALDPPARRPLAGRGAGERRALASGSAVNEAGRERAPDPHRTSFPRHPDAIRRIAASQRDKSFLAAGSGQLGLYFSTSRPHPVDRRRRRSRDATALYLHPQGGRRLPRRRRAMVAELDIHNPASRDHT